MARDVWDPAQYDRFRNERQQPFFDLLGLVEPASGLRVVDLGCGTGELTRILHERLRAAETVGIDRSPSMLAGAPSAQGLRFACGDIDDFTAPGDVDLVFSNAALHWVRNHEALFARLVAALAPNGQLAVQVPANGDHPAPRAAAEVAAEDSFRAALAGASTPAVLAPEGYAALLARLGLRRQHVRLQVYVHHLPSRDDVLEWIKGTSLKAYEERLTAERYAEFLGRVRDRLHARLPDERPYVYTFKRILLWARR